jgi:hypothetical protein
MSTSIKKYLHDIDLQTNRFLNARIHPLTTAERNALTNSYNTGDIGVLVFDVTLEVFFVWDGNAWLPISISESQAIELQEAYDKYTKDIEITSDETTHTIKLISRDDTFLTDVIKHSYIHNQPNSSAQWTITHNLNKYPSVTVVDTANTEVVGDVQYVSANQLLLIFSFPFSGKAYLN